MENEVVNIVFDPEKLADALAESNVSQAQLARAIGAAHRNVVNKIIKNTRPVTAAELLRISKFLKKSPLYFAKNN